LKLIYLTKKPKAKANGLEHGSQVVEHSSRSTRPKFKPQCCKRERKQGGREEEILTVNCQWSKQR
jgi:hypothetical protein